MNKVWYENYRGEKNPENQNNNKKPKQASKPTEP